MKKIVFLDSVHPVLNQRLENLGFNCVMADTHSSEECLKELKSAVGIVIRSRFRMDASLLDFAPGIEFIARSGAGMENIDVDYCEQRGIELINAPEGNRNAVAEHALAMLLGLFNRIVKAHQEVCNGIWDREGNRGVELDGKTVGIIGFGNNGSAFANKLSGFHVEIVAYDKYKKGFGNNRVKECSLNEVLEKSDVISLHIPQTDETIGLVNEQFIKSCAKPFYLINLSRGKIVETEALVNGLKTGKILGACLDVLAYESSSFESFFSQDLPSDFKYLTSSDRVILSPHVGGWTVESYRKLSEVLADKIEAFYFGIN